MVRLVDEALRDPARFAVPDGLTSAEVTLADPAAGTGTFLIGVLRRIAQLLLRRLARSKSVPNRLLIAFGMGC